MANDVDDARWRLDDLLETTGMPDGTVEFIDSLDKWHRAKGFFTPKQAAAIAELWIQYVRDE